MPSTRVTTLSQGTLPSRFDRPVEAIYIVLVLMWFGGATLYYDFARFEEVTATGILDRSAGNRRVQLVTLSLLLPSLIYVSFNIDKILVIISGNKTLFSFIGLTFVSVLWSILPGTSLRRAIALTLTTVFALYVVQRLDSTQILRLVCAAIFGTALMSLFLVLVSPDIATFSRDGTTIWRGIWGHKNSAGKIMAIGAVCFLCLALTERRLSLFSIAGILICTGFLLMTQSRTSLIAGVLTCAFVVYARLTPGRPAFTRAAWIALGLVSFIIAAATIVPFVEQIFLALGRDLSLTNRTNIWVSAIAVGATRPLLGFGFRAFWTDAGVNATSAIHFTGRDLGNGHSGYIDIWLELGVFGVIGFVALLLIFIRRISANPGVDVATPAVPIWVPAAVVFVLIYSITEKVILDHTDLLWFLFTISVLYTTPRQRAMESAEATGALRKIGNGPERAKNRICT